MQANRVTVLSRVIFSCWMKCDLPVWRMDDPACAAGPVKLDENLKPVLLPVDSSRSRKAQAESSAARPFQSALPDLAFSSSVSSSILDRAANIPCQISPPITPRQHNIDVFGNPVFPHRFFKLLPPVSVLRS